MSIFPEPPKEWREKVAVKENETPKESPKKGGLSGPSYSLSKADIERMKKATMTWDMKTMSSFYGAGVSTTKEPLINVLSGKKGKICQHGKPRSLCKKGCK